MITRNFVLLVVCLAVISLLIGFSFAKIIIPRNHNVYLTNLGFEPDSIVISKGDTVTWINTETRYRWPASNFHPTHTNYKTDKKGCIGSALDACQGLKKGEAFSFDFDNLGVFGIHDHLFPGDTMSVKVVSKISYWFNLERDNTLLSVDDRIDFDNSKFKELEYSDQRVVMKRLAKQEPKFAWEYLQKAAIINGEVVVSSHEFAHIVGRELYKKYGFEGIKTCNKSFSYGCFHGVTEQMLLSSGKESMIFIEKECLGLYPSTPEQKVKDPGCIHGIGHGLVSWNNLDIGAALADCDVLSESVRQECWDGAFMEYSASNVSTFTPKDPWKLCRELPTSYQKKCGLYIGFMYLKSVPFDADVYANMCRQAPTPQLETICVRWIGYMVAENSQRSFEYIKRECNSIDQEDGTTTCLLGAAQEIAVQQYLNWRKLFVSICNEVPQEYYASCIKS